MAVCAVSVLVATALAGCRGPTLADLEAVAGDLATPPGWDQTGDEAVADCDDPTESCPRVVRSYSVPGDIDFAATSRVLVAGDDLEVTEPPLQGCGVAPEAGCSLRARRDDVAVRATVTDTTPDAYTVSVRVTEYVGP
ncbi:hypothetical protein [Salsipaludibacter albus]|uniref:hypothetical protein n=1 Tax=Salsipaludibacter albus TaxID=2849650 RepID=UPI001EE47ADD|nr:hypothetical protein [Salsipaludibacter albus]MBY5162050.1 hypothetical protein [Salsipaludibacter albus]